MILIDIENDVGIVISVDPATVEAVKPSDEGFSVLEIGAARVRVKGDADGVAALLFGEEFTPSIPGPVDSGAPPETEAPPEPEAPDAPEPKKSGRKR